MLWLIEVSGLRGGRFVGGTLACFVGEGFLGEAESSEPASLRVGSPRTLAWPAWGRVGRHTTGAPKELNLIR